MLYLNKSMQDTSRNLSQNRRIKIFDRLGHQCLERQRKPHNDSEVVAKLEFRCQFKIWMGFEATDCVRLCDFDVEDGAHLKERDQKGNGFSVCGTRFVRISLNL